MADLDAYFERLGYDGPGEARLRTLERLHALHAEKIPFENLSPFVGEPVRLDLESLQDKLLRRGRGGWCFEHNILFANMLEAIGFDVTRLAARVRWNVPADRVTARSHMLLHIRLPEGEYIADVGFGGLTLTAPLQLEPGVEQATPHEPHRIDRERDLYVLQARVAGEWSALYSFELAEQQLADYEVSNWYLCHHPESQFLKTIIAARAEPSRRHALRGTRYAVHYPDGRTERMEIATVSAYRELLEGPLRIRLPDAPGLDEKIERMISESAGPSP
ncbi:MAG: arylamine N-acetyltransferase [Burkholderiales bacterium]|nr:arylamine N-acetyltransferase [Burkholderiales bacterium]